jgi:hypothetical protein
MGNTISNNIKLRLTTNNPGLSLLYSEKKDNYFYKCLLSPKNTKARNGEVYYNVNKISPVEINYINTYLESMYNILPKRLVNDLEKVRIIALMPSSEGGMPHTRPGDDTSDGIICFPNISQIYSISTFIHELWHIHQRKYKTLWEKLFNRQGWKEWKGELPADLEENRRYNPDTIDCPLWIFQDKWVTIPIFRDISNPKVGEVDIWFYNPVKKLRTRNIPGEFTSYYSENLPTISFEHPRELAAYLLSEPDKYTHITAFQDIIVEIGHISLPSTYTSK